MAAWFKRKDVMWKAKSQVAIRMEKYGEKKPGQAHFLPVISMARHH